ncbi:MAG: Caldesmon [uncultured Sulfurovum sp.]|uniref:Caldesmon n=1 Tax=uncultured Sulfurovum sp. TaxID=269237 RepID=A0A6S6TIC9_9BACT|nr:MAG: Caldesmon [uncultured Sulfurovum sp.]
MSNQTSITCPNCYTQIDVNKIQYHELEERLKREHQLELESKRKEYKVHLDKLDAREASMKEQEEKFAEQLQKATREQVRLEKQKLQTQLRKELEAEQGESMAALQKELLIKSEQVKELNNSKIEIEKLKREKDEVASVAKMEAQKALSEELKLEKEKLEKLANEAKVQAQKELEEANELKMKAKDEQLEQIKRELDNARRKAEQGSMQIQGEALELAIESWLCSQFPFDSVEEVKKGAFGADCVQHVHTREIQNCGVICYESKNTKTWSESWITKLKQDMLKVNADIGVLVTSVYPKEMSRMGFVDGIWICSLNEFKGSVSLLRESLIRLQQVSMKEENKADKMTLLYNYMTGNEFSMQMKAIVDGFMSMQIELDKERRSLMATWKRRQKTIDGVLANTTEMYGALQGIAGSAAIVHIDALELPDGVDEKA